MEDVKGNYLIQIDFPKQWAVDLFISACEGGSNYWCQEINERESNKPAYVGMLDGFQIVWDKNEDGKLHKKTVTPKMIQRGIALFCKTKHYGDQVSGDFDAVTGDVFLQLCCFGEIVYG